MGKEIIAAFDFDGTITTKDTFVPFLFKAFGKSEVLSSFVRLSPQALLVGVGFFDRDQFKGNLVQSLFHGKSVDRFRVVGSQYAKSLGSIYRAAALDRIEWHKSNGHRCIMVSASLDIYLNDVSKELGFDDLLCTVLSHDNVFFDGALKGGNCRRIEKVSRLRSLLGDMDNYEIYSYGDSIGDKEMIAIADHGFYRPFETNNLTKESTKTG